MRRISYTGLMIAFAVIAANAQPKQAVKTFCNPINIPYNFQTDGGNTRREAADPTIVLYQNRYWLFASKQTGYWYSDDMLNWHFVKPHGLPLAVYAPSVTVINGKLYYTAGEQYGTYTTSNPIKGKWTHVAGYKRGSADPDMFQDSDGKVYLYDGCSNKTPLRFTPINAKTFLPLDTLTPVIYADTKHHGWEVAGDDNRGSTESDLSEQSVTPWIEGSYMNKINGKYYWQYSGPGTQYHSYADGVYVADKATGPFVYQSYSPFSFKPAGFITGAGHSCTFADKYGKYWHISTGTISIRHMFERRLVIFPTAVLGNGQLVTNTYLGDYPQFIPGVAKDHLTGNRTPWMLLSYDKPARASSALVTTGKQNFALSNAFDENIQTWWSAATGDPGEWLQVDLKKNCRVNAIQVNFADQDCQLNAPLANDGYQYYIESSADGKTWQKVVDRSTQPKDTPHDYIQLSRPVMARYLRITNVHYPASGKFSLSDLRVFGYAPGKAPAQVKTVSVKRNQQDERTAAVSWQPVANADFYIVRYGIARDKLYSNYQVYKANRININSLNTGVKYYFTVDAINASGITKGAAAVN